MFPFEALSDVCEIEDVAAAELAKAGAASGAEGEFLSTPLLGAVANDN